MPPHVSKLDAKTTSARRNKTERVSNAGQVERRRRRVVRENALNKITAIAVNRKFEFIDDTDCQIDITLDDCSMRACDSLFRCPA